VCVRVCVCVCAYVCLNMGGGEDGLHSYRSSLAEIFSLATRKRDPACRGTAVCAAARESNEREREGVYERERERERNRRGWAGKASHMHSEGARGTDPER